MSFKENIDKATSIIESCWGDDFEEKLEKAIEEAENNTVKQIIINARDWEQE